MINYITTPFKWFFKLEAASGLVLLIGAAVALVLSNSNLSEYYFNIFIMNHSELTNFYYFFVQRGVIRLG